MSTPEPGDFVILSDGEDEYYFKVITCERKKECMLEDICEGEGHRVKYKKVTKADEGIWRMDAPEYGYSQW